MVTLLSLGNEEDYIYNPIILLDGKYHALIRQSDDIKSINSFSLSEPLLKVVVNRHRIESDNNFIKSPKKFKNNRDLIIFLKAEDKRMGTKEFIDIELDKEI